MHLVNRLMSQIYAAVGSLAQQQFGLRGAAWATFTIEQHHCKVVLSERIAALCGSPEVPARLDMVADEPRRTRLHEVLIGHRIWHVGLGASSTCTGEEQATRQMAHDQAFRRW